MSSIGPLNFEHLAGRLDTENSLDIAARQARFVARRYRVRREIADVVAAFAFGEARP